MTGMNYCWDRVIPMTQQADVVIAGAGPAGLGAALTAAKLGGKVLLIEKNALPGGMAYAGEISPFMLNHFGEEIMDRPFYTEWLERMRRYQSAATTQWLGRRLGPKWGRLYINKNYAALSAEDMLEDYGVTVLYEYTLFDTVRQGDRIDSLVLLSRGGLCGVKGSIYIDATGDGVLAAQAGCRIEVGDENGLCQPMTWCFKVAPVAIPDEDFWSGNWRKEVQQAYREAKAAGVLSCPREDVLMFQCTADSTVHFNTTRVVRHDPIDAASHQDAGRIARKQIREFLFWLRGHVRGFENAEIVSMGQQLGIRESRRVVGDFCLTADAFRERRKFPDAVARCNYPIDIHSPTGSGTRYERTIGYQDFYEIPYRCLIPRGCANLLTAGRIISSDHTINSSLRIMPVACSTGQGAGAGAVLALREHTDPGRVDGTAVRRCLRELGAYL